MTFRSVVPLLDRPSEDVESPLALLRPDKQCESQFVDLPCPTEAVARRSSFRVSLRSQSLSRSLVVAVVLMVLLFNVVRPVDAQPPNRPAPGEGSGAPQEYRTKNFLLHTDLPPAEAEELLNRLETMLGFVARYWGRPPRGVIELYVTNNLERWPRRMLSRMAPEGIAAIQAGAGLTIGTIAVRGNQFRSKAVVYAVANHGTPQHEAVHAYCNHAFGGTGPVWYAEGMAEVGQYWRNGDKGVSAPPPVIRYLKNTPPKKLDAIVNNPLEQTGDSWQNYAWRWALCHLLGHNTNYTKRFKPLGLQLLTRKDIDFWQVYGSQAEEINFEYRLFLKDMEPGYRVDLCSWDWKSRFSVPSQDRTLLARIDAAGGWQSSRLMVTEGTEYEYAATGEWSVDDSNEKLSADGREDGRGRLIGVIFSDYQLSEPFELGSYGSFTAGSDGKLYLRCRDDWGAIDDNSGTLTVKTKIKGSGRPLVNPNEEHPSPTRPDSTEADADPAAG